MINKTMDSESEMESEKTNEEYNPFDSVLSRIDTYIEDPKMVTSQTLSELKSEIEQIKSSYEEDGADSKDESDGEEMGKMEGKEGGHPSLMIMIDRMKKGENK